MVTFGHMPVMPELVNSPVLLHVVREMTHRRVLYLPIFLDKILELAQTQFFSRGLIHFKLVSISQPGPR